MKKIYKLISFVALAATAFGCVGRVDDAFDDPSAARISQAMENDNEMLVSAPNGWVMEYYGDSQYGGYNMLVKFNDDNTVTAMSEIYGPEKTSTSHYKFEQSQGVVLSVDEYNEVFHFFSAPHNPAGIGVDGKGMLGDFEFRILSASAEKFELLGKKHGARITMTALPAGKSWADYINEITALDNEMSSSSYQLVLQDTTINMTSSYRTLSYKDNDEKTSRVSFIVTPEGYKLASDLEVNTKSGETKTFTSFKYSADFKWLADDGVSYLKPVIKPINQQFTEGTFFLSGDAMDDTTLSKFMAAKADIFDGEGGELPSYAFYGESMNSSWAGHWGFSYWSNNYACAFEFEYELIGEDTIKITDTGSYDPSNAKYYLSYYSSLATAVAAMTGTFTLTTDNIKNPSWIKMVDTTDANHWFVGSASEIVYPFGQED